MSCTIRRTALLRRPYTAASPVPGKTLKTSRQYIFRTTTHRYTHKKEAVRNIIYLWQHDETAVPNSADSTAPLINSCFKSRLLRHLSTSSFQRYLIIGMQLCVCQALFYKKVSALSVKHTTVRQSKDLIHRPSVFDIIINKIFQYNLRSVVWPPVRHHCIPQCLSTIPITAGQCDCPGSPQPALYALHTPCRQIFRTQNLLILNIVSPHFCHKMTLCPVGRYRHLLVCFSS